MMPRGARPAQDTARALRRETFTYAHRSGIHTMAVRSAATPATRPLTRPTDISPITRGEGALAVYQQLRDRIVRGRLAPGT